MTTPVRGFRLPRCPTCCVPSASCLCALTPRLRASVHFWVLIHPDEARKTTNTARLLQATLPQTRLFPWRRTEAPAGLWPLVSSPLVQPYVLCPDGDVQLFEHLQARPWLPERAPAFILVDGTWSQARKMLYHSPYLQGIPRLAIQPEAPSIYTLRRQVGTQHLSTVEAAMALLAQCGEGLASEVLRAYFRLFLAHSMAARHGHRLTTPLPEVEYLLAYQRQHSERSTHAWANALSR